MRWQEQHTRAKGEGTWVSNLRVASVLIWCVVSKIGDTRPNVGSLECKKQTTTLRDKTGQHHVLTGPLFET